MQLRTQNLKTMTQSDSNDTIDESLANTPDLPDDLAEIVTEAVEEATADLRAEVEDLREENAQLRERVEELESTMKKDVKPRLDGLSRKTDMNLDRVAEIQGRELEKGAHLLADNVEPNEIEVSEGKLERITKDDGRTYFRLPGEEDALERGGAVAHSTADLLPIQRLARYDDDMLASVTNRKPDELAAKAWRERDETGRYALWTKGSGDWDRYIKSSDLADWIRAREDGVSKNWSQELARRTMDAMKQLSKSRLVKHRKSRSADGLQYKENVLVLKTDVDLPGEISSTDETDAPDTSEVAG